MSVLLKATVDRRSASFARDVQALKERTRALQRQYPEQRLLTGKREEGSRVHVVVMLARGSGQLKGVTSDNCVVPAPKFF